MSKASPGEACASCTQLRSNLQQMVVKIIATDKLVGLYKKEHRALQEKYGPC